jgi:hypothetical protein
MAALTLELELGGEARLLALSGDRAELTTSSPSAPGTRLGARLADGRQLRLKVLRCVRRGDEFAIEARLFDASRELCRGLAALLQPRPSADADQAPGASPELRTRPAR